MTTAVPEVLTVQLRITWSLAELVLPGATHEQCLWLPTPESWTVRDVGGVWVADWVEPEPQDVGPPSLAWCQWHVVWWWSTLLDHCTGHGTLRREDVPWPGAAEFLPTLRGLRDRWVAFLDTLTPADLASNELTRWPYTDGRPFEQVVGWVVVELMKNVAEMALLRRLAPGS